MTLLLTQTAIVLLITMARGWLALKVGQAGVIGKAMLVVVGLVITMLTAPILTLLGIRAAAQRQPGSVPVSVS